MKFWHVVIGGLAEGKNNQDRAGDLHVGKRLRGQLTRDTRARGQAMEPWRVFLWSVCVIGAGYHCKLKMDPKAHQSSLDR